MEYLNRKLSDTEITMLKNARSEKMLNKEVHKLYDVAEKYNMYIPTLVDVDGDCLYWCLQYYGICDNIYLFKYELAIIMLFFKNKKNFIPEDDRSLQNIVEDTLDIHYVVCKKTGRMYKYNYDAMCVDLLNSSSWNRVNTELLLTIMSVVLNLRFIIYHSNTGHFTTICVDKNKKTKNIRLGLINEFHYVPLNKKNKPDETYICPEYNSSKTVFDKWVKTIIPNQDI